MTRIRYRSQFAPRGWRWWLILLAGQRHRYEAAADSFADLARKVTMQGVEPGYRATQTTDNGGHGLDFHSLDLLGQPLLAQHRNVWSWLTDRGAAA